MKISIFFLICLVVVATAAPGSQSRKRLFQERSQEGIFGNIGKAAKDGIKRLVRQVGRDILDRTKEILTDGLHLHPSKEVKEALQAEVPSSEGIFDAAGNFILKRAAELARHLPPSGVSHEGIISDFGSIHKIYEAEEFLHAQYNSTLRYGGPSHEGILGNLGGIVIRGLGDVLGGQYGDVIRTNGDVFGRLFYIAPKYPLAFRESLIELPNQEGIFSNVGKLISKGTGKLAKEILRGAFDSLSGILTNIYLARGNFNRYPNLIAPANQIILNARHQLHQHPNPNANECLNSAENNFTLLFNQYERNGEQCVGSINQNGRNIVAQVQDIVLDAVKRVEDIHRETGFCFEKRVQRNTNVCLDNNIPLLIEQHSERISLYGRHLTEYVNQFSKLNTKFDVCLVRHLGEVRQEVYHIVEEFHNCVDVIENTE